MEPLPGELTGHGGRLHRFRTTRRPIKRCSGGAVPNVPDQMFLKAIFSVARTGVSGRDLRVVLPADYRAGRLAEQEAEYHSPGSLQSARRILLSSSDNGG